MAPFGFSWMFCGESERATQELCIERTETLDLSRAIPIAPSKVVDTKEFKVQPVLPEVITPEMVIAKMTRGEWEGALRMLEISAGIGRGERR